MPSNAWRSRPRKPVVCQKKLKPKMPSSPRRLASPCWVNGPSIKRLVGSALKDIRPYSGSPPCHDLKFGKSCNSFKPSSVTFRPVLKRRSFVLPVSAAIAPSPTLHPSRSTSSSSLQKLSLEIPLSETLFCQNIANIRRSDKCFNTSRPRSVTWPPRVSSRSCGMRARHCKPSSVRRFEPLRLSEVIWSSCEMIRKSSLPIRFAELIDVSPKSLITAQTFSQSLDDIGCRGSMLFFVQSIR